MLTDDEVMRLYEQADPARDEPVDAPTDAAEYLDAVRTRERGGQVIPVDLEAAPHRPAGIAACWSRPQLPRSLSRSRSPASPSVTTIHRASPPLHRHLRPHRPTRRRHVSSRCLLKGRRPAPR